MSACRGTLLFEDVTGAVGKDASCLPPISSLGVDDTRAHFLLMTAAFGQESDGRGTV